jgi:rhodanese-related sulfurtransferase
MKRNKALETAVVVASLVGIGYFAFAGGGDVEGSEARRLVDQGARLVDVRTPEEFAAGHLDGAVNIPVQELDGRMAELEPKGEPIVLYCRSGRRSRDAARMLMEAGYTDVHDLGAMSRW